ncbi:uncharacterized protein LOC107995727 isoform X5 [Apis cerana]|uniref:uncharacterized protein LOC107995727 isoform X5 n=1 Tax=Apis cerana TaxID=7461 RepID=UPI002B236455|nr:uncharacterized protein LOC107995727 isoform X5 [Apis cerana]
MVCIYFSFLNFSAFSDKTRISMMSNRFHDRVETVIPQLRFDLSLKKEVLYRTIDSATISEGICSGLREVRIQIPTAVKKGDSAILNCWYDTEGDPLYTVKWYKGGREFYRYAPNEIPIFKTFPIGNLTVKKSESNATQVALTNLELDAAGVYSCEVSADAPSFQTACVQDTMNIVELPSQGPSILGLRRKYRIGDTLRLNCTSGRSKPAANLTWYINDRQSTEVSFEEDRAPPKVIQYQPAATIVGIDYLQPPPNFQTGQKKPDGHVGVKGNQPFLSKPGQRNAYKKRKRGKKSNFFSFSIPLNLVF